MNIDGSERTRLTHFDLDQDSETKLHIQDLVWSPDSKKILFVTNHNYGPPYTFYKVEVDDPQPKEIFTLDEKGALKLKYSPAGDLIAFIVGQLYGNIYILKNGEKIPKNLTANLTKSKYEIWNYTFSPDGKKILFILEPKYPGLLKRQSLYLMNSDGTEQRKIAELKIGTDVDFHWEQ
jgi:Tol biopolymer transport system component